MTDHDADWPCCTTPLSPKAGPDEIRAALLPEYRDQFDEDLATACPNQCEATLNPWRLKAMLQQNPVQFRRLARRAAELITGEPCPEDEPLEITRAKAGI